MATDHGIPISDMTVGISSSGMEQYIADLKLNLLDTVKEKIDNIESVNTALNNGWQGESRDKFDRIFEKTRGQIKNDLQQEFNDMQARLRELQKNYFEQDKKMIID